MMTFSQSIQELSARLQAASFHSTRPAEIAEDPIQPLMYVRFDATSRLSKREQEALRRAIYAYSSGVAQWKIYSVSSTEKGVETRWVPRKKKE